ncbi:MAG: ORF6N domain-containing protein, partial [Prevotellaceae bacterium]|nr:ORF6N domain-containing protein [Candidatus Colivivens caballi]
MTDKIKNIPSCTQPIEAIESRIQTIRGKQVMLDRDLAELYGVETKALNQAVKRNIERFPERYRFQLNDRERDKLVTNCDHLESLKYSTVNPYAFTEQGVSMLASVLKSDKAVQVSLNIIDAFVAMRRFLLANAQVFQRIETLEMRQIATDNKLNQVLSKLDDGTASKIEGIFYEGEVFSARAFIEDLIKSAKQSVIIVDAYIDASILELLTVRNDGVTASVYTESITPALQCAWQLYNRQYPADQITLQRYSSKFHDRFIIIDDTVYHVGASLKDLGKRLFAFTR